VQIARSRIAFWFWYLIPANPILVRVVQGGSRRQRHLWLRLGFLTALLAVVVLSLFVSVAGRTASLTDLAKSASRTFQWAATTQLALMCFLAPAFTASAITQERDSQTLNILLSTPLTNAQIVLGSLMSRLYFVIMLLVAGLPIFLVTMIYGGVTGGQVFESFALSGSTAVLTGALAIFIAMLGVGNRRTILSFYILIALYLLTVYLFALRPETWVTASPVNLFNRKMSWLAPLHPFLALEVAFRQVYAPPHGHLGDYSAMTRYALAFPSTAYVIWTSVASILLTVGSMLFVRRGAKIGEPTLLGKFTAPFVRTSAGERRRSVRSVWHNPVAWREAKTRATGGRMVRWMVLGLGLAVTLTLLIGLMTGSFAASQVRNWLVGLASVQFGLAMIIATNTAATSLTKEKEAKTLDLLMTTPLTSKYILWGKLRGLVSFVFPLLAVPAAALIFFGLFGLMSGRTALGFWMESSLELAVLMVIYCACACVIGLKISMSVRKNVTAVMYSVGVVILLCAMLSGIGFAMIEAIQGEFAAFFAPFTPFTAAWFLVDPTGLFDTVPNFEAAARGTRVAALFGSVMAGALYAVIVWSTYSGLVRSFDMTMRKQTGTS
jgi:ABC-type transport system involved in multi-copper enzyme maturation permease subunit